jgi:peptidyl-dipeptidase Dcp
MKTKLDSITIRTELRPGDPGYVIYLHGLLYGREYGFGLKFETYVAQGVAEFCENYDPARDCIWICEYENEIVGSLALMHRGHGEAQLRYFLLRPEFRGMGLGKRLMNRWMEFAERVGYETAYLLTIDELKAAISLYERHGFVLSGEEHSIDFGRPLKELRFEKSFS